MNYEVVLEPVNDKKNMLALAGQIAQEEGLPPEANFLKMIKQESGGNPNAKSKKNAFGLAQLQEGAAKDVGVNRFDPIDNLRGGARYLKKQFERFGDWGLAHAAYNAGPENVQKYGGVPPFAETQNHVKSIMGEPSQTGEQEVDLEPVEVELEEVKQPKQPAWQRLPVVGAEGANKGIANMLGMPVDLINMMIGGYGGEKPVGGSQWISEKIMPPQTVKPQGLVENIIGATGEQIPYAVSGGLGTFGKGTSLLRTGLQLTRPTVGAGVGVGTARTIAPDNQTLEMIGALSGSVTPMLTKPFMEWLQPQGRRLVESAMKIPPRSVPKEIRDQAVDTMISRDISFSEKGLKKIGSLLDDVNREIDDSIAAMTQTNRRTITTPSQTVTSKNIVNAQGQPFTYQTPQTTVTKNVGAIDTQAAAKRIDDLKQFYSKLPKDVADEFISTLDDWQAKLASDGFVTPQRAQEMKKAIYVLNRKHYGELKNVQIESHKAFARGLKEELVSQNPELAVLNAKDSALINLEEILEKSLNRVRNYDIIRMGDTIMAGVGGVVGGAPGAVTAGTIKGILEMPRVKVALGKALARAKQKTIKAPYSRALIATQAVTNGDQE